MSRNLHSIYPETNPTDPVSAVLASGLAAAAAHKAISKARYGFHADDTPWKVEDYLNATDYKVDLNYVPSLFALEFVNFIKLVNGVDGEENKTPIVHYKMLDTLTHRGARVLNLCHRGIAKTTVMGEYLCLFIGVYGEIPGFGKVNLALYVSDSIENGVKNMRKNLEFRYENSDFLRQYIPEAKFTDIRWEFKNLSGNVFIVKGYGAKTGVRGAKELGQRPQLAILDDLISDEDARSATVIAAVEDTVYKAVNYALHPKQNMIIWSGTPFNAKDPLYKAVESGAWAVNVFPVCEQYPCTREEFRGSWPDRFTYDYVKTQYDTAVKLGKVDTFNQELMLRIMSEEDRLVLDSEIKWYKREHVLAHKGRFNFYITTDFATSAKQSSDYSVISVWALNHAGDWFWVDGICARQDMGKTMNDLFRLCQIYKPSSVGIEVTGQQAGFIPWIQEQQLERNVYFTFASEGNKNEPGIRPTTNKLQRFNVALPLFKLGKMYFPQEMKTGHIMVEAVTELSLASQSGFKSKHDDFIDTISQLPLLNAWRPSEEATVQTSDGEVWELEDHEEPVNRISNYIV
jgi:predicted phage terminase large subunit-like protein